eukprot:gene10893-biopygen10959
MSKVSPRYDEEAAEKLWETVGRPDYDGPKLTMKTVGKWAYEDDPHGYAMYRASSIPKLVKDSWDKGDRGLGQILHYLLSGTVKKTGKGSTEYYIFQEDTCRWDKVEEGWVKNVASKVLEVVLRDVDLWISTQAAQMLCIGVVGVGEKEDDSRSKADLDAKKKKVATLINYVMSYRGVTNAMALAGPLLMDETFEQRLDSNRHLIGIKGGSVVDLRTGQKRQRVAEDMVHNELDVTYDNNNDNQATTTMMTNAARAEWMHRIVEKIMGGDEDMARFLQRLLGYATTGEVREEVFPIWTGSGRNGKGLLTQALQQLLGAYYKEMNCAIISDSRSCTNIDAERAKLIGARLAVFNELKSGEKLKTNEVQLLTGGDGFPAKALYKDPVTIQPRHLAILVTNYMPEMSDVIVAMVERICVVHFPVTFRDLIPGESETATLRQCDRTMKDKLKSPEDEMVEQRIDIMVGGKDTDDDDDDSLSLSSSSSSITEGVLAEKFMAAAPEFFKRIKFVPDLKKKECIGDMYYCDPATNRWSKLTNPRISNEIETEFKSKFHAERNINKKIRSFFNTIGGRNVFLQSVAALVLDETFADKLDVNPDLFAVNNGVFDTSSDTVVFRKVEMTDHVSRCAKWDSKGDDNQQQQQCKEELDDFFLKILPVEEERDVVLAFFAGLLSGRRKEKKFLAFTDKTSGDNGKSTLVSLMGSFFDEHGSINNTKLLTFDDHYDDDDHDECLKTMKGAGVVLVFNEGKCPRFNVRDSAFLKRMVVVPMRSNFVLHPHPEREHEFERRDDLADAMPNWRSALANLLKDHFSRPGRSSIFDNLPVSMTEWKDEIVDDM